MALLHKTHGRGVVLVLLAVGFHVSGCGSGVSDRDVRLTAAEIVEACREVDSAVTARDAVEAANQAVVAARQTAEDEREALIDQLIAEEEQLAAAQADWSAKVAKAEEEVLNEEVDYAKYADVTLSMGKSMQRMRLLKKRDRRREVLAEARAWRREAINQLAADERMVNAGERVAEADDRVAEADDRVAEAGDRMMEIAHRVTGKAKLLVQENSALLTEVFDPITTCKALREADDPASEARSLLTAGIAKGKKAREIFELTSEFFEACPDGHPEGWDESDWRAFIAKGDEIAGTKLRQACALEAMSIHWALDLDLFNICAKLPRRWDEANKKELMLACQAGRDRGPWGTWERAIEGMKREDLQSQT